MVRKIKFSTGLYSYCRSNEDIELMPFKERPNQLYFISPKHEGVCNILYFADYSHVSCKPLPIWHKVKKLENSCKKCKWGLKMILNNGKKCYKTYEPL